MTSLLDLPLEIGTLIIPELSLALLKLFEALADIPAYPSQVTEMQAV